MEYYFSYPSMIYWDLLDENIYKKKEEFHYVSLAT